MVATRHEASSLYDSFIPAAAGGKAFVKVFALKEEENGAGQAGTRGSMYDTLKNDRGAPKKKGSLTDQQPLDFVARPA